MHSYIRGLKLRTKILNNRCYIAVTKGRSENYILKKLIAKRVKLKQHFIYIKLGKNNIISTFKSFDTIKKRKNYRYIGSLIPDFFLR